MSDIEYECLTSVVVAAFDFADQTEEIEAAIDHLDGVLAIAYRASLDEDIDIEQLWYADSFE